MENFHYRGLFNDRTHAVFSSIIYYTYLLEIRKYNKLSRLWPRGSTAWFDHCELFPVGSILGFLDYHQRGAL